MVNEARGLLEPGGTGNKEYERALAELIARCFHPDEITEEAVPDILKEIRDFTWEDLN